MAGYTRKNLRTEVEDSAPRYGLGDSMEAHFARNALDCERSGISYQRIGPGFRVPFGHSHAEQEEVYVVLSGSGRARLDDEIVELGPLDALRIAPATIRAIEAGPDGLELVAFGAPRTAENDAEMLPGWWADS